MSAFSEAALCYHRELQWNVIPCEPGGKKPLVKWERWQTERQTDTYVIECWKKWPNANVAEVLGPISNTGTIDIDTWDGKTFPYPGAWTDKTGKGLHQSFLLQKGVPTSKTIIEVAGFRCEWLCSGQYRILPPSVHPNGSVYTHLNGALDFVPDSLLALLRGKERSAPSEAVAEAPSGSGACKLYYEGGRDNMLAELCGSWIRKGLSGNDLWNMLCGINMRQCVPPLPAEDVERIYKSISKSEEKNHPRAYALRATRMSKVASAPIEWLWKPWLPEGQISIIEGDQGIGKSTLMLDIAARVSAGKPMPKETAPCKQGGVLIATSEDIDSVVKGRLELTGANMEQILFLRDVLDVGGVQRPLKLPDDTGILQDFFQKYSIRLFIMDPWEAFLSDKVDSYKNQSVRTALYPLHLACDLTRCTVALFRHLTKSKEGPAGARGQGSVGVGATARSIMLVTRDVSLGEGYLLLSQHKNSLARGVATTLTARLVDEGDFARIEWTGHSPLTADQALAGKKVTEGSDEVRRAIKLLRELLREEPQLSKDVRAAMVDADVSERNEKRARAWLEITVKKTARGWLMSLPERNIPVVDMEN